jgi:hypothetical protein
MILVGYGCYSQLEACIAQSMNIGGGKKGTKNVATKRYEMSTHFIFLKNPFVFWVPF